MQPVRQRLGVGQYRISFFQEIQFHDQLTDLSFESRYLGLVFLRVLRPLDFVRQVALPVFLHPQHEQSVGNIML